MAEMKGIGEPLYSIQSRDTIGEGAGGGWGVTDLTCFSFAPVNFSCWPGPLVRGF